MKFLVSQGGAESSRVRAPAFLLSLLLSASLAVSAGCGIQTEEANQALERAERFQAEAEAALQRLRTFPEEWKALFNAPRSQEQIASARELADARVSDLELLEEALEGWDGELRPILELNVEPRIKEYVRLKLGAIDFFADYVETGLRPVFGVYRSLVEQIAQDQPRDALDRTAAEITEMVGESAARLDECRTALQRAEEYFEENRLGE